MAEKGSTYRKGLIVLLGKVLGVKVVVQMNDGPITNWYHSLFDYKKRKVKRIFNRCDKMLFLGKYWKH